MNLKEIQKISGLCVGDGSFHIVLNFGNKFGASVFHNAGIGPNGAGGCWSIMALKWYGDDDTAHHTIETPVTAERYREVCGEDDKAADELERIIAAIREWSFKQTAEKVV